MKCFDRKASYEDKLETPTMAQIHASRKNSVVLGGIVDPPEPRQKHEFILEALDSKYWIAISAFMTILSLVWGDFALAALPKEADQASDVILMTCFVWFIVEITLVSVVKSDFFNSFWFWLDVVATISLMFDVELLLLIFGINNADVNIASLRAGRAGRSARSAIAIRAVRMFRFARLLRIVRVFKFIGISTLSDFSDDGDPLEQHSSVLGKQLSDEMTKKIILVIMTVLIAIPWLDPSSLSLTEVANASVNLFEIALDNGVPSASVVAQMQAVSSEAPLLYLQYKGSQVYMNEASTMAARRTLELWQLETSAGSIAIWDNRSKVAESAWLGLGLTFFTVLAFFFSTIFVNSAAMHLVVEPIAKMTQLLLQMAGVIGLLGGANTVEKALKENNEMYIVQELCNRVATIFSPNTTSDPSDHEPKKMGKALSLMAMRSVTTVNTGDRMIEINVTEKHRTSAIESKVQRYYSKYMNSGCDDLDLGEIDGSTLKEFESLNNLVQNKLTNYCLKMFMTSNLTINNLCFYQEALQFREEMIEQFGIIYNKYIHESSPAQINLDAAKFAKLEQAITGESEIGIDTFNEAIDDTWKLLEENIFKQFLNSSYARFYVWMKENEPVYINQLQLSK